MPYFGIPIRNGLPIGLGTLTALAQAVAVVVPPVSSDPYFEYVSLLLNASATNGAQNNTFLDSSTNAFSITRNGNPTQGTFSPFSQTGWSNFFDGTGDYLLLPSTSNLAMGTGDFCIEMWIYPTALSGDQALFFNGTAGDTQMCIFIRSTSTIRFSTFNTAFLDTALGTVVQNTWNHVVVCRSGTTASIFINGTRQATGTVTTNFSATDAFNIGRRPTNDQFYVGYMSNLRAVKGASVYDPTLTTLTVPTAPLTAITNTSLLTCQSNRFIDNSSNAFAITRNGDVSVQAFSPFNPTAAWSASTNGGSGYFDGNGDELNAGSNAAFAFGTGAYTVEAWVYTLADISISHTPTIVCNNATNGFFLLNDISASGNLQIASRGVGAVLTSSGVLTRNTWNHVVAVRSGTAANQTSIFLNGTRVANGTDSTNWTVTGPMQVGGITLNNFYLNGYASNVRVVKGTAVYDPTLTTLTVPTAPLTAITNTSLLLNFTNAGIYDSASGNDLETVGNAQVSTVQAKWGTTSMAFDGTGDWLTALDRPALRFGTAPFTIEGWVYYTNAATRSLLGKGTSTTGWNVSIDTAGDLIFSYAASSISGAIIAVPSATWTHFAIVRTGTGTNQTNIYIDGVLANQGTVATNFSGTDVLYIGASRTATQPLTGYIDDLRITNGYARYTANFTPPTAAFPLN